ncbi:MAG: hypothetical protein ACOC53_07995, partial [Candidatus Saliniplasma sp.]
MKKIIIFMAIILVVGLVFSGCTDILDDEYNLRYEYSTGDTWTYKLVEEEYPDMTVKYEVVDPTSSYKGEDAAKLSLTVLSADYDDEDISIREISGDGSAYIGKNVQDTIYMELELRGEITIPDLEDWFEYKTEISTEYDYTGSFPESVKEGDTFLITKIEESTTVTYVDGEKFDEESTKEITTRNYEVVGEETVTVNAGEFECIK